MVFEKLECDVMWKSRQGGDIRDQGGDIRVEIWTAEGCSSKDLRSDFGL